MSVKISKRNKQGFEDEDHLTPTMDDEWNAQINIFKAENGFVVSVLVAKDPDGGRHKVNNIIRKIIIVPAEEVHTLGDVIAKAYLTAAVTAAAQGNK